MRGPLLAALAVLLVLPVQPAGAQSTSAPQPIEVLADPRGDVRVEEAGVGAANPTPRWATLDLVSAMVQEQARDFVFTLTVASLDPTTEPPLAESAFYAIHFLQGDVRYAIQMGRFKSIEAGAFAQLSRYDPAQDRYYAVDYLELTMDASAATFTVVVPRDLIVDSQGARPYPGTSLSGFWAESQSFLEIFTFPLGFLGQPQPTLRDRMPDAGESSIRLTVLLGPAQTGSARLSSPLPTRQSNGEATTFLYTVEARNVGEAEERFRLTTRNLPDAWKVTLQEEIVSIPAGGAHVLPVLVSVPFAHEHGTFRSFLLRMESTTQATSAAELELGVRYPRVPQPAGHHDTLFLHGAKWTDDPTVTVYATVFSFNTEYAWMNALEEDPGDQGVPVPADPAFHIAPPIPGTFQWTVPLAPDLAIGLDFDLARTGAFAGEFEATTPLLQASLGGELVLYTDSRFNEFGERIGGNRTALAHLEPTAPQDIPAGGSAGYTATLRPLPAADLVPFREGAALVLQLNLTGMRPDTFEARDPPRLRPGATLNLPLFEYHDPVDAVFASTSTLRLTADVQDRPVNPGRTAVFPIHVHLAAEAQPQQVRLVLEGPDASWARLLGPAERLLAAGETWDVAVALAVPADAAPLRAVDLIVRAESRTDPELRALVRLFATVVTDRDVPDEAALASELDGPARESSPGPGIGALAALAAAVALRRRGRPSR